VEAVPKKCVPDFFNLFFPIWPLVFSPGHAHPFAQRRCFTERMIFGRRRSLIRVHPTRSARAHFIISMLPIDHLFDHCGPRCFMRTPSPSGRRGSLITPAVTILLDYAPPRPRTATTPFLPHLAALRQRRGLPVIQKMPKRSGLFYTQQTPQNKLKNRGSIVSTSEQITWPHSSSLLSCG
jgi:hypothetical protein